MFGTAVMVSFFFKTLAAMVLAALVANEVRVLIRSSDPEWRKANREHYRDYLRKRRANKEKGFNYDR